MLLDPLEEQLNLPAALVELADGGGRQGEMVGDEHELLGVNAVHGRKSISWANSVWPTCTAASSSGNSRRVPHAVQVDTTPIRRQAYETLDVLELGRNLNRTAVMN
jgi:hypothetical protein